jgi:hypothetical protein
MPEAPSPGGKAGSFAESLDINLLLGTCLSEIPGFGNWYFPIFAAFAGQDANFPDPSRCRISAADARMRLTAGLA